MPTRFCTYVDPRGDSFDLAAESLAELADKLAELVGDFDGTPVDCKHLRVTDEAGFTRGWVWTVDGGVPCWRT